MDSNDQGKTDYGHGSASSMSTRCLQYQVNCVKSEGITFDGWVYFES